MRRLGRRRGRPTPMGSVLERVYPAPEEWPTIRAFAAWSRGMPARVVRNARPVRLARGVLLVHVTSPVWAQELSFLEKQILERLASTRGAARVSSIRFRVGPLPDILPLEEATVLSPLPELVAPPKDPVLDAALSTIGDDELRDVVARAAKRSLSRVR